MLHSHRAALSSRSSLFGSPLNATVSCSSLPSRSLHLSVVDDSSPYGERFRLHNLSPQEGSRKKKTRKGRGYSAGKGGSCGYGMRGQKSRSGSGIRPGFEGGQMPLYRRVPKLRGIAGGMPAGKQKFVTVNLWTLSEKFEEGATIDLETLKKDGIINASGKERNLPLKVLGEGTLDAPLSVAAAQFSESARSKIEAAGGTCTIVPTRQKWTQAQYEQDVAEGRITPKKTKRYYYLQSLAARAQSASVPSEASEEAS